MHPPIVLGGFRSICWLKDDSYSSFTHQKCLKLNIWNRLLMKYLENKTKKKCTDNFTNNRLDKFSCMLNKLYVNCERKKREQKLSSFSSNRVYDEEAHTIKKATVDKSVFYVLFTGIYSSSAYTSAIVSHAFHHSCAKLQLQRHFN